MKRRYGGFQRTLRLRESVVDAKVDASFDASFENDVLRIALSRRPETVREIRIESRRAVAG